MAQEPTHPEELRTRYATPRTFGRRLVEKRGPLAAFEAWRAGDLDGAIPAGIPADAVGPSILHAALAALLKAQPDPHSRSVSPEAAQLLKALSETLGTLRADSIVQAMRQELLFDLSGRHVYEVSPGLAVRLKDTALLNLRTEDLRLPYPSLFLVIPREAGLLVEAPHLGALKERVGDLDVQGVPLVPAVGAYVAATRTPEGHRLWELAFVEPFGDKPPPEDEPVLHHFSVQLRDGISLDEALDETDQLAAVERGQLGGAGAEYDRATWRDRFRFVMNAVIYATWPDADREDVILNKEARQLWERLKKAPAGSSKRERIRDQLRGLDERRRTYLGRGISQVEAVPAGQDGKPLSVLSRVQGHWKKQPHGPGGALRKLIWVEPYWRGPHEGALGAAIHGLV